MPILSSKYLFAGSISQALLSLICGFLSDHPFGSINSTTGLIISSVAFYVAVRERKAECRSELAASWQAFSAAGFLSHGLAMMIVKIYGAGSCDNIAEGCEDGNTTTIAAIILLLINAAISSILYLLMKRTDVVMPIMRTRFRISYITMIILGIITWMSGVTSIDGAPYYMTLGVFCYLSGVSSVLVTIYPIRRRLAYPIALASQWLIAVIILSVGLIMNDDNGNPLLRSDVVTTQVISIFNLFISTTLMFVAIFKKWEYQVTPEISSIVTPKNKKLDSSTVSDDVASFS